MEDFPHRKGFGKLKKEYTDIVTWALVTGMRNLEITDRSFIGGQRQRAWIQWLWLKTNRYTCT